MRDTKSSIFRGLAILLLLAAAISFCIAIVDVVYTTEEQDVHGYWILLAGWLGFLFFQFAWFANPLTVLSLLLMRKHPWWALFVSALALMCMAQAFLFSEIPTDTHGNTTTIISRGVGFYCWIASIVCVFYAVVMSLIYNASKRDVGTMEETPINSTLAPRYAAQNSINTVPLSYPSHAISTKSNP